MSILLTGGTGKTAVRLAQQLADTNVPCVLASRRGGTPIPNTKSCQFNWTDESTFENPFIVAPDIEKAYLVAPATLDALAATKPFIDFAKAKGVKRFVALTASTIEAGGIYTGKVHEYIMGLGVEWAVIRPTWFMGRLLRYASEYERTWLIGIWLVTENLSELQHLPTIRDEDKICSAARDGMIPWVAADDIACVAFRVLVDREPHNRDYVVLGPELFSYSQVAEVLSEALGRKIRHEEYSEEKLVAHLAERRVPEAYAKMLGNLDTQIADGAENIMNKVVEEVGGRLPTTLRAFVEKNKTVWMKS
ncbi:MAG: hypothetical protein Q9190_007081 [Brigantiaea leucoxantha]